MGALVETSRQYRHLFDIYVPIALGVFALVVVILAVVIVRYRGRKPEQAASWHEHNPLESAYAVMLGCVVVFLLYVTYRAEHQVDTVAARERPALTVDVYGAKWEWHFHYPAYGIDRYSGSVGHETLVLPTDEPIRMRLVSLDVIHEFWVPELRYKHDLIPGYPQDITITFPDAGSFPGQCAEFCGLYHSRMTFTVDAVSPASFAAWARAHARRSTAHAASGGVRIGAHVAASAPARLGR